MTRFLLLGVLSVVLLAGAAPVMAADGSANFFGIGSAITKAWDNVERFLFGRGDEPQRALPKTDPDEDAPPSGGDKDGFVGDQVVPRN